MASKDIFKGGKPPFLFRAASKDSDVRASRGLNTADEVDPLFYTESKYHTDLTSIEIPKARMMIHDHINYNYDTPSEFSS
jgi:hypothetical protein